MRVLCKRGWVGRSSAAGHRPHACQSYRNDSCIIDRHNGSFPPKSAILLSSIMTSFVIGLSILNGRGSLTGRYPCWNFDENREGNYAPYVNGSGSCGGWAWA